MMETRRNPLDRNILQEIPEIVWIGLKWESHSIQHQQSVGSVSREVRSQERQREEEEEAQENPQNDCVRCHRKSQEAQCYPLLQIMSNSR